MASLLGVTAEGLAAEGVQMGDLMADLASAISAFSATICGTVPAGADSASLLAANNFSLHGLNFVVTGVESQTVLGQASGATGYGASRYGQQDQANAALL